MAKKYDHLGVVVVSEHRLQCLHLPVVNDAVLTTQTDVEEPQQIVDLLCRFADAETFQQVRQADRQRDNRHNRRGMPRLQSVTR